MTTNVIKFDPVETSEMEHLRVRMNPPLSPAEKQRRYRRRQLNVPITQLVNYEASAIAFGHELDNGEICP